MYADLCGKIDLVGALSQFLMFKLTIPGFVLPALLITITNYFVNDLGNESFYLPLLIMCVILQALRKFDRLKFLYFHIIFKFQVAV